MLTDAKRKSNKKWNDANAERYQVLGCKVKRSDAVSYQQAAKQQGTNINSVLKQALDDLLTKPLQ